MTPVNSNKTGTVSIRRNSKRSMASAIWFSIAMCFIAELLFWVFVYAIFDEDGWKDVASLITAAIVTGVILCFIYFFKYKGTMVESVSFDYDANQVAIVNSSLLNHKHEIIIPFGSFHCKVSYSRMNSKSKFIRDSGDRYGFFDMSEKVADLVSLSALGWDKNSIQMLDQELEGFNLEK